MYIFKVAHSPWFDVLLSMVGGGQSANEGASGRWSSTEEMVVNSEKERTRGNSDEGDKTHAKKKYRRELKRVSEREGKK